MAAVLVVASLSHVCCDRMRVDLGVVAPATLASAQHKVTCGSNRQVMARLTQPGFSSSVSSGDPALPCKLIYIALPPDADLATVRVVPGSYSTEAIPGCYDIGPAPVAVTSGGEEHWGFGKSIVAHRNKKTYGRNTLYPAQQVRVRSVGNLRTWKVAVLEFWPYAYNPVTGRLRRVRSDHAQLSFSRKPPKAVGGADALAPSMAAFVTNLGDAAEWYGSSLENLPAGYAIITTNAVALASEALPNFAASLRGRGFAVSIVTESDWGGGVGDIAADRIRAWLKSNYLALNLQYVLLIGDPKPTTGDVPMKMLWPRRWSASYREAPSDYYYADLTGNWDKDGDGFAGEEPDDFGVGGIDRIPEVYVGRIPYYGDMVQLDSILTKSMLYKSSAHGDWARKCLMAMKPLDSSTPCYQLGEQITFDSLFPLEAQPDRVYDDAYGLPIPPEHYPCDYDRVLDQWKSGAGLVFWMTHGSYNTASSVFVSSRCEYLDDSKPSFVYMASCSNGQPEYPGSLGYCVLAKGGVTTLSASRVSWYYIRETDYRNTDSIGGLGYQYARFLAGMEPCGRAAIDARLATPMSIWPNHLVFNLYGDPSLVYDIRRSVASAKQAEEGAIVKIDYCLVSRVGSGSECYVQDADRCGGIRISGIWSDLKLTVGMALKVIGRMTYEEGIRVLQDAQVTPLADQVLPSGETPTVNPLAMLNRNVGSPMNQGLLVTVWGRVVSVAQDGFVISDGSVPSGLRIACLCPASVAVGGRVKVTGISTPDGVEVYQAGDVCSWGE